MTLSSSNIFSVKVKVLLKIVLGSTQSSFDHHNLALVNQQP